MAAKRNQDAPTASKNKSNHQTNTSQPRDAQASEHGAEDAAGGRGWHGNPEGHAEAGRKGGQKVAKDRDHMAAIGRKGGEAVSRDRQHMAEIGRKGGQSRSEVSPAEAAA